MSETVRTATARWQGEIDACAARGGGTVTVPPGVHTCGSLQLRAHVRLHLENGAVLRASGDLADYPPVPFAHVEWGAVRAFLWAMEAEGITLDGDGVVDLNDEPFMEWGRIKEGDTFEAGVVAQMTPEQLAEATVVAKARPTQPLFFLRCDGLRVRGLRLRRGPCWTLCIHLSRDVRVEGVTIDNHLRVPNNDGIHLCGCEDVIISGCVIRAGDDCIAITSIADFTRVCRRIVVHDCILQSRSAAVRLGHLASKVEDVRLHDLEIVDSNRGLCLFAGEGGWVRGVRIHDVRSDTRIVPGHWWGKGEPFVVCAAGAPGARIEDVEIRRWHAVADGTALVAGERGNIRGFRLANSRFLVRYGRARPVLGRVLDLQPAPLRPAPDAERRIPWLIADGVAGLRLEGVEAGRAPGEGRTFDVGARIGGLDAGGE